jgi:AraC-like DNA-binding protein
MSVSGLCHKFKSEFGKTVVEYILEKRLAYARSLLTSGEAVAVKEVAVASGFDDPSYFSRIYKKHYGKTPKEDAFL